MNAKVATFKPRADGYTYFSRPGRYFTMKKETCFAQTLSGK
jgi:hypothetical protein